MIFFSRLRSNPDWKSDHLESVLGQEVQCKFDSSVSIVVRMAGGICHPLLLELHEKRLIGPLCSAHAGVLELSGMCELIIYTFIIFTGYTRSGLPISVNLRVIGSGKLSSLCVVVR